MTNNVYVLYNRLSCRYGDVMAFPTDGFAVRALTQEGSVIAKSPNDYELWRCGTCDIETGKFELTERKLVPWVSSSPVESKSSSISEKEFAEKAS